MNSLCTCSLVEGTRVPLMFVRGVEGSDYINASFIDVSVDFYREERSILHARFSRATNKGTHSLPPKDH